ncbi:MAG: GNAT family N-acetyltransferase [Caldilineaceae bacterium]|nr:GNAT family N-acetyltransferase [Caldilineaceae bacterium]
MTLSSQPWVVHQTTVDTHVVTVRPLQPADADFIFAMHERLSPESIYYRYLQYRRPTLAELATVCHLAPERGAGFVATLPAEPGTVVGVAYYVREAYTAEPTAEPGILVEDRFQAQGIGRQLWQQLQHHAQMNGLHRLRVWSHPNNRQLARLVQGGGFPYRAQISGGLREYLVDLGEPIAQQVAGQMVPETDLMQMGRYFHAENCSVWN